MWNPYAPWWAGMPLGQISAMTGYTWPMVGWWPTPMGPAPFRAY